MKELNPEGKYDSKKRGCDEVRVDTERFIKEKERKTKCWLITSNPVITKEHSNILINDIKGIVQITEITFMNLLSSSM